MENEGSPLEERIAPVIPIQAEIAPIHLSRRAIAELQASPQYRRPRLELVPPPQPEPRIMRVASAMSTVFGGLAIFRVFPKRDFEPRGGFGRE